MNLHFPLFFGPVIADTPNVYFVNYYSPNPGCISYTAVTPSRVPFPHIQGYSS